LRKFASPQRPILLCPGPVHVSKNVLKAVASTNMSHREPEFTAILEDMAKLIKPVIGIPDDDKDYEVAFITGSGTAANETILSSLGTLGPTLVISNGEFGERLHEVVRIHNPDVDHIAFNWQQPMDLRAIELALGRKHYTLVAMVHHETSTGMLNPVPDIARLAHAAGALIAVDTVSSIGAEKIEAKTWGLDAITGSSGKALSAFPGVGILVVNQSAISNLRADTRRVHYLDLHKHLAYMRNLGQTPNTPAIHSFVALHAALKDIKHIGLDAFKEKIRDRGAYTRAFLDRLTLGYADYGPMMTAAAITCVALPPYITYEELSRELKKAGIVIYDGKGPLKGKIFQIGHIGALRKTDTRFALEQIEKILHTKHRAVSVQHSKNLEQSAHSML
jgi:2-aminoethylphosphonate-pyruvate transaminase